MKQNQPSSIISNAYWPLFRIHAHLLIAWGYDAIKSQLRATNQDDEESITGLLAEAIERILESELAPWCSNYEIFNEAPISGGNRLGKDRRATDLVVKLISQRGRPRYVFEAKPQNYTKKHQRTDYYVGLKGMERFLEGEYADYTANYPEVGMIAYILSDSVEIWRDRLKNAIAMKSEKLRLNTPQKDVQIIDEFPLEWVSNHQRSSSGVPLSIYHILLDCTYTHNP